MKIKNIFELKLFSPFLPKWVLLIFKTELDIYELDLDMIHKSGALEDKEARAMYYRIYKGTEVEYRVEKAEEAEKIKNRLYENDGVITIKGMKPKTKEDVREFRIFNEKITVTEN